MVADTKTKELDVLVLQGGGALGADQASVFEALFANGRRTEWVPEPLEVTDPVVKYEFIRMPDSTGFGDYTESGQVIPVSFQGRKGGYVHAMYLNDDSPISGGREIWGFPKKLAEPCLHVDCTPRICELVEYSIEDVTVKDAWGGPAGLDLHDHALAPVSQLPVREILSATHILADLTLGLGRVVHDYLPQHTGRGE